MTTDDANVYYLHPSESAPTPGYTQVVEATVGRTIYVSGQITPDCSDEVVGKDDLEAQARQIFENLEAALASAGADFGDIVKSEFYLSAISQAGLVRRVRDGYVDTEAADKPGHGQRDAYQVPARQNRSYVAVVG